MQTMPNNLELPELVDAMRRQTQLAGKLYMHLTNPVIDRFGPEGERTIRQGLRQLGAWRAQEMRAMHHAMGKPINMQTLTQCWDSVGNYLAKDEMEAEGRFRPNDARYTVSCCPISEVWKEAGFHQWGHVYCDEFHQACASGYHPDGNVVVPINMMKGDARCEFQWIMPPDSEELDLGEPTELGYRLARDYQPSSELEAAWMTLRRSNRLFGGWIISLAGAVLENHGEAPVIKAFQNWGSQRGHELCEHHKSNAIPVNAQNFMRHHDYPATQIWAVTSTKRGDGSYDFTIMNAPQDDALVDYETSRLGEIMYHECYPAMLANYLPGARMHWHELRCTGGAANQFTISEPERSAACAGLASSRNSAVSINQRGVDHET